MNPLQQAGGIDSIAPCFFLSKGIDPKQTQIAALGLCLPTAR